MTATATATDTVPAIVTMEDTVIVKAKVIVIVTVKEWVNLTNALVKVWKRWSMK